MLEKIKEDVTDILEAIIEEHSDYFYKYEISDNFSQIYIYETPGGIGRHGFADLWPEVISRLGSLIGLYHGVKKGGSASQPTDYTFDIIEPDH